MEFLALLLAKLLVMGALVQQGAYSSHTTSMINVICNALSVNNFLAWSSIPVMPWWAEWRISSTLGRREVGITMRPLYQTTSLLRMKHKNIKKQSLKVCVMHQNHLQHLIASEYSNIQTKLCLPHAFFEENLS